MKSIWHFLYLSLFICGLLLTPLTTFANLSCKSLLTTHERNVPSSVKRGGQAFQVKRRLNDTVLNGFEVKGYFSTLHPRFKTDLLSLTEGQVWIDLGSGDGNAINDYYSKYQGQASSIGVSFDRSMHLAENVIPFLPQNSRFETGSLFEDIPVSNFQEADLISDVMGVLAYTEDLSATLKKVFTILKTDGTFYFFHGQGSTDKTQIMIDHPLKSGDLLGRSYQTITNLLRMIDGLEVETHYLSSFTMTTMVTKREGFNIEDLPNMETIKYDDSLVPPERFLITIP